jgi:hypothetical protein
MERAEKKKRRLAKKAARQRSQAKNKRTNKDKDSTSGIGQASAVAMAGFTSSVQGILRGRTNTLIRRRGSVHEGEGDRGESGIEMENIPRRPIRSNTAPNAGTLIPTTPGNATGAGTTAAAENSPQVGFSASTHSGSQGRPHLSSNSETSSTSHTPSLNPPRTLGQFLSYPTTWLWVYLRQLRRAHEDAAKKQAIERAERRQKVFGEHVGTKEMGADEAEMGWGLGAFGIREHEEGERRLEQARGRLRSERLLPDRPGAGPGAEAQEDVEIGQERNDGGGGDPGPSTVLAQSPSRAPGSIPRPEARSTLSENDLRPRPGASNEITVQGTTTSARPPTTRRRTGEEEWTDVDHDDDHDSDGDGDDSDSSDNGNPRAKGWSWWGPLRKWRLADRSTF